MVYMTSYNVKILDKKYNEITDFTNNEIEIHIEYISLE